MCLRLYGWWILAVCCALAASGWAGFRTGLAVQPLPAPPGSMLVADPVGVSAQVWMPRATLVAEVASFDDELFAYLLTSHIRDLVARDRRSVWLTYHREAGALRYTIRMDLPADLLTARSYLQSLETATGVRPILDYWTTPKVTAGYSLQSEKFDFAYTQPAQRKLESLPRSELTGYIRRFIRLKSVTDARFRLGADPEAVPPDRATADQLARDIVAVTDFYGLPVDFFLGIGAMENNYLNVRGDIGNAIWKRRADRGDVVLRRGPRGVLVLNESSGIWQITRETLRYAHRLYVRDNRDYSQLPEHLRPPEELDLDNVPPAILTTYAGLFFRNLLDRFDGNVELAVGAYNGGPGRPNPTYSQGTRRVARHARRLLEHAAVLRGRTATEVRFLRPAP